MSKRSQMYSFVRQCLGGFFSILLGLIATNASNAVENQPPPTIAIIIDDLGNHKTMGNRLIDIPTPLTLAFLPLRIHTKTQAKQAYFSGKEVMLHVPMENIRNVPLGAAGLNSQMSNLELSNTLHHAIASVPYIRGVNNHMGSILTKNQRAMDALMEVLQEYPLYFVDSRTTALSVAHQTASRYNIPALNRDIFLDNSINVADIHQQFRKLIALARRNGTAIGIGHPYLETVQYLEQTLPQLGEEGIAIATVAGIWSIRQSNSSKINEIASVEKNSLLAKTLSEKIPERRAYEYFQYHK